LNIKGQLNLLTRLSHLESKLNKEKYSWQWRAYVAYEKECALFTHFLRNSGNQKYLEDYNQYVKSLLLEKGQKEAYSALFSKESLKVMQEEFINHIRKEFVSKDPRFVLSSKDFSDLIKPPPDPQNPLVLKDIAPKGNSNNSKVKEQSPSFDPGELIVKSMSFDTALSVALNEASNGSIDKAVAMVNTLVSAKDAKQPLKEIASKEKKRLIALGKLRTDFLLFLKKGKKSVSINQKGRRIKGIVKEYDEKKIVLKLPKNKELIAPLGDLTPAWLGKSVREKRYKEAPDWLMAYACLLSEKKTWKRWLKKGGLDGDALLKDAPTIQERLKEGRLVYVLSNLASSPLPADEIEANLCLKKILSLFKNFKETNIMKKKEKALRLLSAHAYAKIFDSTDLGDVLAFKGDFTINDNKEVRLAYDFKDSAQLEDFESIDYLDDFRETLHGVETSKEDTYFEIKENGLHFSGQGCRRLKLALQTPIKVSYDFRITSRGYENAETPPYVYFTIGVCDDTFGNCIMAGNDGAIRVIHKPTSFFKGSYPEKNSLIIYNQVYHLRLTVDDKSASSFMDGQKHLSAECGPLKGGALFMWVHSDIHNVMTKLIFEGRLDEVFLSEKRAQWVKEKMKSFPKL